MKNNISKFLVYIFCVLVIALSVFKFLNLFNVETSDLIATLNLFLVIILYDNDSREARFSKKAEYDLYWFKDVILQPNIGEINKTFNGLRESVLKLYKSFDSSDSKQLENVCDDIGSITENFRDNFIYLFQILNKEYYDDFSDYLDKLNDDITEKISEFPVGNQKKYTDKLIKYISDKQIEFQKKIYNIGCSILEK